jgi:hypothetical protein
MGMYKLALFTPIDLTDYSLLPNGLVSMLTYFLFLAVLRLNTKVILNPTKHKTQVSI